jgi:pantothenate kinase
MPPASSVEGLVEVGTALEVLRRVDLLAESNALAIDIGGSLAKLLYLQPYGSARKSSQV